MMKDRITWGIDHTGIGVSDMAKSRRFYDAVLGALEMKVVAQLPEDSGEQAVGYGKKDYPVW